MSSFLRAVCRCVQGKQVLVGETSNQKKFSLKNKQELMKDFSKGLVWFPVVVTVRGDLATYDLWCRDSTGWFLPVMSQNATCCHCFLV